MKDAFFRFHGQNFVFRETCKLKQIPMAYLHKDLIQSICQYRCWRGSISRLDHWKHMLQLWPFTPILDVIPYNKTTHTTFLFAFPSTASFVSQKQLPFSEHFKKKILSFSPMEEKDYFLRDVLQGALVQWPMCAVSVCLKRFRLLAVMTSNNRESCCWCNCSWSWCVFMVCCANLRTSFSAWFSVCECYK